MNGVFARKACAADTDADGLCDAQDIRVTFPGPGFGLDCSNPGLHRPTMAWSPGNYDKFRVFLGTDPAFSAGTRITSGDALLTGTSWTPPARKSSSACARALALDPVSPLLYVRILGVDVDVPKGDPLRKTYSEVAPGDVNP